MPIDPRIGNGTGSNSRTSTDWLKRHPEEAIPQPQPQQPPYKWLPPQAGPMGSGPSQGMTPWGQPQPQVPQWNPYGGGWANMAGRLYEQQNGPGSFQQVIAQRQQQPNYGGGMVGMAGRLYDQKFGQGAFQQYMDQRRGQSAGGPWGQAIGGFAGTLGSMMGGRR